MARYDCDSVAMEDGSPEQNSSKQLYGFTYPQYPAHISNTEI